MQSFLNWVGQTAGVHSAVAQIPTAPRQVGSRLPAIIKVNNPITLSRTRLISCAHRNTATPIHAFIVAVRELRYFLEGVLPCQGTKA